MSFLRAKSRKNREFIPLESINTNSEFIDDSILIEDNNEYKSIKNVNYRKAKNCWRSFESSIIKLFSKEKEYYSRTINFNNGQVTVKSDAPSLPKNVIRNQKFSFISFLPLVIFEQFKYFFNLYFLLVALSQFIPELQIGYLFTYVAPLVFVLSVTILKEAYDDFHRFKRDREVNSQLYNKLTTNGLKPIPSHSIKVGDMIQVETNQRAPADLILLYTSEESGGSFIRTDQLDGETDWKLRKAVSLTQRYPNYMSLNNLNFSVYIEKPKQDIYNFVGSISTNDDDNFTESLNVDNTIWANTVVASGTIIGLVVYTGSDTRSSLNASKPRTKIGCLDDELNFLSKVLFGLLVFLAFLLVALNKFSGNWFITFFRFILLFSSIIPISLRVNLDMGKTLYSYFIMKDRVIEGTIVRNSTIPEELGRISYLLTDKTGTLTQNDMVFKKLHLGDISFSKETLDDIMDYLTKSYNIDYGSSNKSLSIFSDVKLNKGLPQKIRDTVTALALCHNVTPTIDNLGNINYQASSPDEIALVKFTESVGVTLFHRDLYTISLRTPNNSIETYSILNIFPFTSETKRMGIILRNDATKKIYFYMKGADSVMRTRVQHNDWLDEECGNMAREGYRTLVFGMKELTEHEYKAWSAKYEDARSTIEDREKYVQMVVEELEDNLTLLGLTGVEDKLQIDVKPTLETLKNAGIKIWMLTGDKIETATCIAVSSRLISRVQSIYTLMANNSNEAYSHLSTFNTRKDTALIIDGSSLQLCIDNFKEFFINTACKAPAVVCCRCSPTQKAEIVKLIKEHTKLRTCAIGDGGNDVSMIQAADVGIGIVGKEGNQASLAADYSVNQFSYISRLLLWHGRNSYKRSSRLSQFIMHRGLIISLIQAIFSAIYYFAAISIYSGWLMVGYTTFYTMLPVFALVLDTDVSEEIAFQFPELYHDLQKGRQLSLKTFFMWCFISVYQGGIIMLCTVLFFSASFHSVVSITFTTLIITELLNAAYEINNWHWFMIVSQVFTISIYIISLFILDGYFDITFILTWSFVWRVILITSLTTLPVYIFRLIKRRCDPPAYFKIQD